MGCTSIGMTSGAFGAKGRVRALTGSKKQNEQIRKDRSTFALQSRNFWAHDIYGAIYFLKKMIESMRKLQYSLLEILQLL